MQTAYEGRQFDGQDPRLEGGQLGVGADVDAIKDDSQVPLVNGGPVAIFIGGGRSCRIVFEHRREKRRGSR